MTKNSGQRTSSIEVRVAIARQEVWKCESEISSAITRAKNAKNELERAYIEETATQLKKIVDRENGQVTERDFVIFLNDLSAKLRDTWR